MEAFEKFVGESVLDGVVPGAVFIARSESGKFTYSGAISAEGSDYSTDTILEIASLTKLVTTVAALQLVERNSITLDEDISQHIPNYAKQKVLDGHDGTYKSHQRRNAITLHHLLTHSAGGAYYFTDDRIAKYVESAPHYSSDGTIDSNFDYPLSYEPGEGWAYSNAMDQVGKIIEKLSNKSLEDYFHENIFKPLGITTASFWAKAQQPMAVRKTPNARAIPDPYAASFTTGLKECFGGQGLLMSLEDYVKILTSLLLDDQVLLGRDTTALMFKPQLSPKSKTALLETLDCPAWAVGDLPRTGQYDWGYGGLLIDGDDHPYRRRGTLLWSGAPSLFWFIDREAGVCGVFGTQVLPPSDPLVCPLITKFEQAVYLECKKT